MDQTNPPLTSGDVAAVFGVTMTTVKRWADKGVLPSFKTVGGHYRFQPDDVAALKAAMTNTPTTAGAA